jgi:hypothetical protein
VLVTGRNTDPVTNAAGAATKRFFIAHYWRVLGYASYWDRRNAWYPAWLYKDAFAIYPREARRDARRERRFILRDATGRRLYLDWGCRDGRCPQYAADIGDPRFRAAWIADARAALRAGYRGLYIDDVDLDITVSDGWGPVRPIDPRTGAPYTDEAWRRDMAAFMAQVRAAFPRIEIVHNTPWFEGTDAAASADLVAVERGLTDPGLTGGDGEWSLGALFSWVDAVHALGTGVVYLSYARTRADAEYNVAGYLLTSNAHDAVSARYGMLPRDWWAGYQANLGEPLTGRVRWEGLWRRDFAGGVVLLNEPGGPPVTVTLAAPMRDTAGRRVAAVTLGPAAGAILSTGT